MYLLFYMNAGIDLDRNTFIDQAEPGTLSQVYISCPETWPLYGVCVNEKATWDRVELAGSFDELRLESSRREYVYQSVAVFSRTSLESVNRLR